MASASPENFSLVIKWSGKEYTIDGLSQADTVKQLKEQIKGKTGVLPERQKLLGLKFKGNAKLTKRYDFEDPTTLDLALIVFTWFYFEFTNQCPFDKIFIIF